MSNLALMQTAATFIQFIASVILLMSLFMTVWRLIIEKRIIDQMEDIAKRFAHFQLHYRWFRQMFFGIFLPGILALIASSVFQFILRINE